jgi:hypothetical protein
MSPTGFAIVDRPRFDVAWPLARLAGRRRVAANGESKPQELRRPQGDATTLRRAESPAARRHRLSPGEARRQGGKSGNGQIKPREPRRPRHDATTLRGSANFAVSPGG